MGAWGERAFDNDTACDWAFDLEGASDLSPVAEALGAVEGVGSAFLDANLACVALAACEVLARLRGPGGYRDAYTERVDDWVSRHALPPSPALLARARAVIDRILGEGSELRDLWDDVADDTWRAAVLELRGRLGP